MQHRVPYGHQRRSPALKSLGAEESRVTEADRNTGQRLCYGEAMSFTTRAPWLDSCDKRGNDETEGILAYRE